MSDIVKTLNIFVNASSDDFVKFLHNAILVTTSTSERSVSERRPPGPDALQTPCALPGHSEFGDTRHSRTANMAVQWNSNPRTLTSI